MKYIVSILISLVSLCISSNVSGQMGNAYIADSLFSNTHLTDTLLVDKVIESKGRFRHIGTATYVGLSSIVSDGSGPGLFVAGNSGQLAIQSFGNSEFSGDITILHCQLLKKPSNY